MLKKYNSNKEDKSLRKEALKMGIKENLLKKIQNKQITVGVVGLGYVGLPLAVEKAKAGFKTIGVDVQDEKVKLVNEGHNYIGDVVDSDLKQIVEKGMLKATTDFSFIKDVDFIAICVPTPLDEHQQPDISFVENSAIAISKHLSKDFLPSKYAPSVPITAHFFPAALIPAAIIRHTVVFPFVPVTPTIFIFSEGFPYILEITCAYVFRIFFTVTNTAFFNL